MSPILHALANAKQIKGTCDRVERAKLKSKLIVSEMVLHFPEGKHNDRVAYSNTPHDGMKKLAPFIEGNCMIVESVFLAGEKEVVACFKIKNGKVSMIPLSDKELAKNPQHKFSTSHNLCKYLQKLIDNPQ